MDFHSLWHAKIGVLYVYFITSKHCDENKKKENTSARKLNIHNLMNNHRTHEVISKSAKNFCK